MLKSLRIDNFALIDQTSIEFTDGFTVITGETGSGKSILLNALNLILGERANFSVIGNRKDKSIVEGEIDLKGFGLQAFFELHELDYFDTVIVRREIYKQGRSRAFINDVPVQLNILKELTSRLIHIHSQYNTLELKERSFQMEILDILAGTIDLRHEYTHLHNLYLESHKELREKEEQLHDSSSKADYDKYQLEELEQLRLGDTDYGSMQEEFKRVENADELKATLADVVNGLNADGGSIDTIQQLVQLLSKNEDYSSSFKDLGERLNSALIELQDIANESENELESISVDPARLQELAIQLDSFNKLLYKHKVSTQEELLALQDKYSGSSSSNEELIARIAQLKKVISDQELELNKRAEELHSKRLKEVPEIEASIQSSLQDLKLKDTKLLFKISKIETLGRNGLSNLDMFFSPNAGFEPVLIHQAASGGELSRVMLALQSLISKRIKLQTILFDEIDTGVSGDVAQKIGATLRSMGEGMQVIAITHLPQVAAKGGQHLVVSKEIVEGQTTTSVSELTDQDRVEEVARLMSGDSINEAAISNAKALMA